MAKRERDQRSPRGDRTRLVGLHFRNANPEATADLVLRLALGVRPFRERGEPATRRPQHQGLQQSDQVTWRASVHPHKVGSTFKGRHVRRDLDTLHAGVPPWLISSIIEWLRHYMWSPRYPVTDFIRGLERATRSRFAGDDYDAIRQVEELVETGGDFGIRRAGIRPQPDGEERQRVAQHRRAGRAPSGGWLRLGDRRAK